MVRVAHFTVDFIATVVTVELSTLNYLNCDNSGYSSVRGNFNIMLVAFFISKSTKKILKNEQKRREISL